MRYFTENGEDEEEVWIVLVANADNSSKQEQHYGKICNLEFDSRTLCAAFTQVFFSGQISLLEAIN